MSKYSEELNRKLIIGLVLSGFIGIVLLLGIFISSNLNKPYIAKVNGKIIPLQEYKELLARKKQQYATNMQLDFKSDTGKAILPIIKRQVVEALVQREIINQEAIKLGINISKSEIDKDINEMIKFNFGGDKAKLEKTLRDTGSSLVELGKELKTQKTIKEVYEKVTAKIKVDDKEIEEYYKQNIENYKKPEEVRAYHILVKTEKEAIDIRNRILKGEDFGVLAKKYSLDTSNKDNNGDLGFFSKGRMVKPFEDAVWKLKVGEISEPVKTEFGYHIIKKIAVNEAKIIPFNEAKNLIKDRLLTQKKDQEFNKWYENIKKQAKIEINEDMLKSKSTPTTPNSPTTQNNKTSSPSPK